MKKILMQNERVIKSFNRVKDFYLKGPYATTNNCVMPLYVDDRAVFSDPKALKTIAFEIAKFIKKEKISFDFIVGGATAGIPIATAVGLILNRPTGYVRKMSKGGGTNKVVEGSFKKGNKALLIDDALGHGAGKMVFLKNIRKSGFKVDTLLVVCSRGYNNPGYFKWFKKAEVNFISFCDLRGIINNAKESKIISQEAWQLLNWYFMDAINWNKDEKKWQYFLEYKKKKSFSSKYGV